MLGKVGDDGHHSGLAGSGRPHSDIDGVAGRGDLPNEGLLALSEGGMKLQGLLDLGV